MFQYNALAESRIRGLTKVNLDNEDAKNIFANLKTTAKILENNFKRHPLEGGIEKRDRIKAQLNGYQKLVRAYEQLYNGLDEFSDNLGASNKLLVDENENLKSLNVNLENKYDKSENKIEALEREIGNLEVKLKDSISAVRDI